ncbi:MULTISPECIES: hypothetical protein [unclassified Caulobacter]|uniref:hypothetical protein n=1 Tax=unclassified Caulobacter TaxID=2648921 RepID=UPI001E310219|nr:MULTISPECIES: hypothetical protein [unclassified Caulobacter]
MSRRPAESIAMLRAFLASALLAAPTAVLPATAWAQAPIVAAVEVTIGPDLAAKADKLGAREFDYLTADLKRTVERRLSARGALSPAGGQLKLIIDDAQPNRPTPKQLGDKPGLSLESFSLGGAKISGEYVAADGVRSPVRYSWYENDIRQAAFNLTWSDAETAFARLARRIGEGKLAQN